MTRTYTFLFNPEPEGGYTATCPALPGLVTYGDTLEEARRMARDAMNGLIEVMLERGETIPESDAPDAVPRFHRLYPDSIHWRKTACLGVGTRF
jgi:antitoxin HicB